MKNTIILLALLFFTVSATNAQLPELNYCPLLFYGEHTSVIEIPGKEVKHKDGTVEQTIKSRITPVRYTYLQSFVKDQKAKGVKVKYDVGMPEEYFLGEDTRFLVLVKGNNAVVLFNKNDTSYIITRHLTLTEKQYGEMFNNPNYPNSSKEYSLKQIEQTINASIILLNQENLKKVISAL